MSERADALVEVIDWAARRRSEAVVAPITLTDEQAAWYREGYRAAMNDVVAAMQVERFREREA